MKNIRNKGKINSTALSEVAQVVMAVHNFIQHQFHVAVESFGTIFNQSLLQHPGRVLFL